VNVGEAAKSSVTEKPLESSRTTARSDSETSVRSSAIESYKAGQERFDAGDIKGAVSAYLQSVNLDPQSAEVYLSLGHAYVKLEKYHEARNAFKASINLNSKVAEAHYGAGLASYRMRRFQDAADSFKKAIALNPKMTKAHYGISLAYAELGQTNALIEEYKILQKLDPALATKIADAFQRNGLPCWFGELCR
jgi:tetratricopeptide (TPR) repeat protein